MDALAWLGVTAQVVVVICAVRVGQLRRAGHTFGSERAIHRMAAVLLIACLLPVPVLLAADASALAWGLWGAGYLAAGVVHAIADTLCDITSIGSARQGGAS